MQKIKYLKKALMVAVLSTATMMAFADDAPVYDADNYPPQFDGQTDAGTKATATPASTADAQSSQAPSQVQTYAAPNSNLTVEQRLAQAEQQITNMQHAQSSSQVDAMHAEIQNLHGQVDSLNHQLQQLQAQQKSMYSDLDKRLSKSSTKQSVAVASDTDSDSADAAVPAVVAKKPKADTAADIATPSKSTAQPNVAEEQQVYQTAYDLIKAKKYDQAIATLKGMLKKYPTGQFAANAHYWLGELYGLQNKNDQSAVEFASVVKNYPDSPKVSDAQLKLGLIYAAQFKWNDAKTSFKKVINHYPGTASARLAAEQLKQIKVAGH